MIIKHYQNFSLFNRSPEDDDPKPSSSNGVSSSAGLPVVADKRSNGVSEADLQILHHQKLQLLYILVSFGIH